MSHAIDYSLWPTDATSRALKAAGDQPPPWVRDAFTLRTLLQNAWDEVSRGFARSLKAAFRSGDEDKVRKVLSRYSDLGERMLKLLGTKPAAVLVNAWKTAHAFWVIHGREFFARKAEDMLDEHWKRLAVAQSRILDEFVRSHPERILHPEIERQLVYMRTSGTARAAEAVRVAERLERVTRLSTQQAYWDGLSSVHVARLWHSDGIMLARENGIRTCYVTGPLDKKTCPVCRHMLGLEFSVEAAAEKIESSLNIEDPDEYVTAWKFPRLGDVDNMSRSDLRAKGYLPPFHNRCRHGVAWLRSGAEPKAKKPLPGPTQGRRLFPDPALAEVYDAARKEYERKTVGELAHIWNEDFADFREVTLKRGWTGNTRNVGGTWLKEQAKRAERLPGRVSYDELEAALSPLQAVAPTERYGWLRTALGRLYRDVDTASVVDPRTYVRARALAQVYMEKQGVPDTLELYRGTGGEFGRAFRRRVGEARSAGERFVGFEEDVLVGASESQGTADRFGRDDGGITVKRFVRREDIVFPKELFSEPGEFEYIIRNKGTLTTFVIDDILE